MNPNNFNLENNHDSNYQFADHVYNNGYSNNMNFLNYNNNKVNKYPMSY